MSDLASIIAALRGGKPLPPKTRAKPAPKAKPATTPALSVAKAYAQKRTGYVTWKALAKIVEIQPQECSCCGTTTEAVRGEYYKLENGQAHAVWLRPEGYEIEAQEELPIEITWAEPRTVSACASCARSGADLLFTIETARNQLELPF